ncbi:hypothetical protein [Ancylobacter lacus]|uniref:hypothetical protein n=1 Tax=Ancylobacter lacus TaxID=2579970 RepID=UPI001BCE38F2|nr:hypothetical protein [Ancylobacter lacus]MBS7539526.1 hypothetical protein [Ancylobacter lacus]
MADPVPIPTPLYLSLDGIGKQGARYDTDDSPSDTYYGYLSEIENVQLEKGGPVTYSLQFELVPFEWIEAAVMTLGDDVRELPPPAPVTLLVFDDAPLEELARTLATTPDDIAEGDWFIITLSKGVGATRAGISFPVVPGVVKAIGRKVPTFDFSRLRKRYRPKLRMNVRKVRKLLAAVQPREVGVMDVGQASCNLIYDENGTPQIYTDVGLPMFFNFASLPPVNILGNVEVINPGPCLGNNPPGILTHFHWDHYSMLAFANNLAVLRNRDWIFPPQVAGPLVAGLIVAINATMLGQVHVFPAGLGVLAAGYVTIIACLPGAGVVPGDLNNTGIAVVAHLDTVNNWHMLLPGDAAFQSIPGIAAYGGLRWMTATHHGSDTNLAPPPLPLLASPIPAPNAVNAGRLAYSYGVNGGVPGGVHCYGHPRAAAVAAYPAAGWGVGVGVASTAETGPNSGIGGRGNILMADNVIPPPCAVANCPFHVFPKNLV